MNERTVVKLALCLVTSLSAAGCSTTENAPSAPAAAIVATPEPPSTATATPPPSPAVNTAATQDDASALIAIAAPTYPDIWSRIRTGYGLEPLDSNLIARHEQWFVTNPEFMQAMMDRARLYLYYITEEVSKRKMPMEIALLPAIESAYKPYAYSRAKASGLWQFIAPTGRLYGLKANWWYDQRRDVIASTRAALDYLEKLHDDFGDWQLALAAYNAGEGKIARMIEYNRRRGLPTNFQSLKLRSETINYVPRLVAMANIVASPEKYGVTLLPIPNQPYFISVDTGSQIDLSVVSRLTDMPISELQSINPHLNRWVTPPDGPHLLLVPVDKRDALVTGLGTLADSDRVRWQGHQVQHGETLSAIARRYGVTPEAIRTSNSLRSNTLRTGQDLMIPISARPLMPLIANPARPKPTVAAWHTSGTTLPVIHRVRSGETLWSIARRYGVLVSEINKWNLREPNDVLKLGQRLRIFPSGKPSAAIADESPEG